MTRGYILSWLDSLGKWALLDYALLAIFKVAFHFYADMSHGLISTIFGVKGGQQDLGFDLPPNLPHGTFIIDVRVYSSWGIYLFLLSVVLSLALSHKVIEWHNTQTTQIEMTDTS